MLIGLVRGNVVATQKIEKLAGKKLLVVEPFDLEEKSAGRLKLTGRIIVAVDTVGAGEGEYVLLTKGADDSAGSQADAVIVGIIDKVNIHGQPLDFQTIKQV